MKKVLPAALSAAVLLSACQPTQPIRPAGTTNDQCGASLYAHLVGKPLPPIGQLDAPGNTRYYGAKEELATNNPRRLNFVLSTENAAEAFINPDATVMRVFCG